MKQFTSELNTLALDVALEVLFKTTGRDEAKRAYELLKTQMEAVFAAGAASREGEINDRLNVVSRVSDAVIREAEHRGYEKAVYELNIAGDALLNKLDGEVACEQTALVNAATALG